MHWSYTPNAAALQTRGLLVGANAYADFLCFPVTESTLNQGELQLQL